MLDRHHVERGIGGDAVEEERIELDVVLAGEVDEGLLERHAVVAVAALLLPG